MAEYMGHDKGTHGPRTLHHEDQGRRSSGAQVLSLDWWLHPVLPEHIPADVGVQGRVRRVRPNHCAQKVLLSHVLGRWRLREGFFPWVCQVELLPVFIPIAR